MSMAPDRSDAGGTDRRPLPICYLWGGSTNGSRVRVLTWFLEAWDEDDPPVPTGDVREATSATHETLARYRPIFEHFDVLDVEGENYVRWQPSWSPVYRALRQTHERLQDERGVGLDDVFGTPVLRDVVDYALTRADPRDPDSRADIADAIDRSRHPVIDDVDVLADAGLFSVHGSRPQLYTVQVDDWLFESLVDSNEQLADNWQAATGGFDAI